MTLLKEIYRNLRTRYPGLEGLRPTRAVFGNRVSWSKNLQYLRYHAECRRAFLRAGKTVISPAADLATRFERDGYGIFTPVYESGLLETIRSKCDEMVRAGHIRVLPEEDWFIQFSNNAARIPEIFRLITPEVAAVAEACFRSHFKIYSSELYRIVPTSTPPKLSGLWHTDNYPPGIYKIMVYLTECDRSSGALGLHTKENTRRLLRRGFFDRFQADPFRDELETGGIRVEGPAGTVLFWNSNLIHRANPPVAGHHDVVAFKLLPSCEPWSAHLSRMGARVDYGLRCEQTPSDPSAD